jgi:hypothetical protein
MFSLVYEIETRLNGARHIGLGKTAGGVNQPPLVRTVLLRNTNATFVEVRA